MKNSIKFLICMVLILIFLFITVFIFKRHFIINNDVDIDSFLKSDIITDVIENDRETISYYSKGMKTHEFLTIYKRKGTYVEPEDGEKYSNIYYEFRDHNKYEELVEIYKKLNISDAVKLENIGISEDGRDMYSIEIGYGNKTIMMDAGIHAAEIANPLFLTKFMVDLVNNYEDKKNITQTTKEIIKNYKLIILPCENPDGYDLHLFGLDSINNSSFIKYTNDLNLFYYKGNINGVDINRNMPSQHAGLYYNENIPSSNLIYEPTGERLLYYAGESLGSENETKNIMYWMLKHYKTSSAYIAFHSAGRSIFNGKPNLSDNYNSLSKKYANVFSTYSNKYNILSIDSEDIGYGNDGTTTDFYSELVSGFKFNNETGRLASNSYRGKTNELPYKSAAITVETLYKYTNSLETIKNEWITYKLYDLIVKLIKLS